MLLDIFSAIVKTSNAIINARHYAVIDRYAFAGPYYLGNVIIYFCLFLVNLIFVVIDIRLSFERERYTRATLSVSAANAGYAAIANAVFTYIIILNDTQLAKRVHRAFGFVVIVLCVFHTSVKLLHQTSLSASQELHTTILIVCLFTFALLPIVKYFTYETFVTMHSAIGIVSAYSLWRHVSPLSSLVNKTIMIYFAGLLAIFTYSFFKVAYQNFSFSRLLPHAFVSQATGLSGVVELDVWLPRYLSVKPGQYINVWMPRVQIFSIHPLMIAKAFWNHEKGCMHLTLFVQGRNGFSKQLLRSCPQNGNVRRLLFFSGPFGSCKNLEKADTVIMVVSGLGLWSIHNYLERLLRLGSDKTLISHIILVWKTKCITLQEQEAINRWPILDKSRMLKDVRIFDESTALLSPIHHGRITILPNPDTAPSLDLSSTVKMRKKVTNMAQNCSLDLELLVNDPVTFARQCNGASFFDRDDYESVDSKFNKITAVLVSAENSVKDKVREAVAKSSRSIDFYELEFTPHESPDPAERYEPFDIIISSITEEENFSQ